MSAAAALSFRGTPVESLTGASDEDGQRVRRAAQLRRELGEAEARHRDLENELRGLEEALGALTATSSPALPEASPLGLLRRELDSLRVDFKHREVGLEDLRREAASFPEPWCEDANATQMRSVYMPAVC